MSAYYNECDPHAAQWLRNLIAADHIAPGIVDERSIVDVRPDDLRGYTQCHFFAGIGVWSYALRCAGWADTRPVWSGSCPCQPFSAAGKGDEFADERHLWPAWFELIRECRPVAIFGEQVASGDALAWLDHVCADLEGAGYAVGAVDSCAAGYGAPHIRQRLYFVGALDYATDTRRPGARQHNGGSSLLAARLIEPSDASSVADAERGAAERHGYELGSASGGSESAGDQRQRVWADAGHGGDTGPTNGFWRDAEWLPCCDGKARAAKSGIFPLAHGSVTRVGRLRAYGNCIVAPQATAFIESYMSL